MSDNLTSAQRSKCMKRIKSNNTSIELLLRKELWGRRRRYRINDKSLPGKPDIVFRKNKIAVFCDSEYFHGKDWETYLLPTLKKSDNSSFWIQKISRNIQRDKMVNEQLISMGWTVLRFWGKDIKRNPSACADIIESHLNNQMTSK